MTSSTIGSDVLKKFAQNVTISSTKDRISILQDVARLAAETDLPEAAVKGIFKFLVFALGKYRDGRSRHAVLTLIQVLAKKSPDVVIKNLQSVLSPAGEAMKNTVIPCRSSSGEALMGLSWTCEALRVVMKSEKGLSQQELKEMVSVQVLLVFGALADGNKAIDKSAYRKMCRVWKCVPGSAEQYAQALESLEVSMHNLCTVALLFKYLVATKDQATIDKHKERFVEDYLKVVLASRTRPPVHVLESCHEILRHVTHADFKGQILPATQKCMLRSPEICLQTMSYMIAGVKLDLSQYSQDLAKLLGTQLISKDERMRQTAQAAIKNLAKQISDPEAAEKLVTHFFGVLNGSEGKLTVADQKLSVLQGVGSLFYNTVSGSTSLQNLSITVTEFFLTTLQQEVHEGTLVHALAMLSLWCTKFYTVVPDKLMQWFKKGITLKTTTSAVRNAYILCMNASFHGDTLLKATEVIPILIQTLDKAHKQPTQSQIVTEAVSAACLLVRLSLVDIESESKLSTFWTTVLDNKKQLLVNEKFLSVATDETLQNLVTLAERLILDFPQKMTETIASPYYRLVVFCLTRKSWTVRKHAINSTNRLLSLLGGSQVSLCLIKEFNTLLQSQKLSDFQNYQLADDDSNDGAGDSATIISPRILSDALITICSVQKADVKEAESIALATLLTAHHPYIAHANSCAWVDILRKLNVDAANFVRCHIKDCLNLVQTNENPSESVCNAVSTLAFVEPAAILPPLLHYVLEILGNPDLTQVTQTDYHIFLTPDGQLYDNSIIESAMKSETKETNIKRENRLYSHKEQLAELELRKELEKKKGKKDTGPKLTKKQEEMVAAQKEREAEIRTRLRGLDKTLQCACSLVLAALKGNKSAFCVYMKDICALLSPLLQSPLAASRASQVFVDLGQAAFEDKLQGIIVSNVTLRQMEPVCDISVNWTREARAEQAGRVIQLLHRAADLHLVLEEREQSLFPACTFAFIYYLLWSVLRKGAATVGGDEAVCGLALQLITEHAKMRKVGEDCRTCGEEYNPSWLPLRQLLELCLQVVGTLPGSCQQGATQALREIACCSNGDDGCATVSQEEISVLLEGLQSPCTAVRDASLQCLQALENVLPNIDDNFDLGLNIAKRVWVASNDVEDHVKRLAEKLKEDLDLEEPCEELSTALVEDVIHDEAVIRRAAAETLAQVLGVHQELIPATIQLLLQKYEDKLFMPPPQLDQFGRLVEEQPPDMWHARSGIALALHKMAALVPQDSISDLFDFYVPNALGDRNPDVRSQMRDAALACVNTHGKENVNELLPVFENFMANAPDTAQNDTVRQSIVILMGTLAKHLDSDNPKVKPIAAQLISALSTPSQEVQEAVANCLPPLVPSIKQGAPDLVQRLLHLLLESDNYGERRGAAYGLAGLIKGMGLLALKQQQIMDTLTAAIQDKKNPRKREGALFAFEMLCNMLGRLFEPYIVNIIQHLLLCFGDNNQYVREAADDCAKAVMRNLSAHGVKLVLPALLNGLEEDQWRTKTGSVELLGAMAHCAPKQLSACLPNIVPKLTEVLTDSHIKVQRAGSQALLQIGSVIRNPEIQAIVPDLIDALQDPTKKTTPSLHILLNTKFVHFVDAPSLALIMPVIQRAFQDRTTDTRKMAAQIMGNMYSLTDQKDLSPYLQSVIPGLKQCLLDPVPEVRSVSARALGAMVKGMGETIFEELLPWLMENLVSEQSSVDRSGAAQGLSEAIGGMGLDKLKKLMPGIIETAERDDIAPFVRDGYIMTYIYLPTTFGRDFAIFVGPILPSILKALADESEYVRDTALRAGQRIITLFADTAISLLLPEIENGLFADNWRIRFSSVQLLGDLLYKISGVSGKMSTESAGEDDNFGTETSQQAITKALGVERRNRVLAGLYMGRSDTALLVRQSALHVWKVIVSNTPRTLREILPTLFSLLLGCLASTSHDKRTVAARTLGDLVRKLGERVLPEIIPILERGLDSEEEDQRQGVCIGLSEIMASTSRDHVLVFADSLIPTVRRALCDSLPDVREAAAKTFDNLHANIGNRALDEILPALLKQLDDPSQEEAALDGLKQVMTVKSRVVLPYLIPQLISPPVNTKALSLLTSVAGDALTRHLGKILPALMTALSEKAGTPDEEQELSYCRTVVLSVEDEVGVRTIMEDLLSASQMSDANMCASAVTILHAFCKQTELDFSEYVPQLLRGLIYLFTRTEDNILLAAWNCLDAVTKKLDTSEMLQHIADVRTAVRFAVSDFKGTNLPGFSIPKKGITPVLPIFREGILNGSPDMKEAAAIGLGEVINLTSPEALKPSVVNITGPLIRILGDRFAWQVKVAVLETLTLLLGKVGMMLKPFLPQLQTTFLKALNDPNRSTRLKAAAALGKLIVIHTRTDPLFTELHTGIRSTEDTSVKDTMLQALRFCLAGAGSKMSESIRKQLTSTLSGMLGSGEDSTRMVAAGCMGVLCGSLGEVELGTVMLDYLLEVGGSLDWQLRHGRSVALGVALKTCPDKILTPQYVKSVTKVIMDLSSADRIPICQSGLRGIAYILQHQNKTGELTPELLAALIKGMKHDSNDVKQLVGRVATYLAQSVEEPLPQSLVKPLIPPLVNGTKEKNTMVRASSEYALVAMLHMRQGDAVLQSTMSCLESGMQESLKETVNKTLKKLAGQPQHGGKEDIDDTFLT
ncbi:stalled ribosome sensor GCN1-like [Haliotis asinina]|uniref:stalled ribosome sensor GCN1-like n=1 Tax=Haliotis asinina TaxID=109174 RepID=UPI00353195DE